MNGKKKLIAGLLAGFFIAGGAGVSYHAYAAGRYDDMRCQEPGMHHRAMGGFGMGRGCLLGERYASSADQAKVMANIYGVSESEIKKAIEDNIPYRAIEEAAFLAQASGKSFQSVLDMKTDKNSWRDVEDSLKITDEQYRNARRDIMTRGIAYHCRMDNATARSYLEQGYRPMDLVAASRIAEAAKVDLQWVLDAKTIKNDWEDVAESFGLDDDIVDRWDRDDRDDRGMTRSGRHHRYDDRYDDDRYDDDDYGRHRGYSRW